MCAFKLDSTSLASHAFPTQIQGVSVVSHKKYILPSPLLTSKALQLIKEVYLESKHFEVPLQQTQNYRNSNKDLAFNDDSKPPIWKKQQTEIQHLHLNRPLLLAEPQSLDLSLTEKANLLADFSSSCSYRMDSYLRGLETLCQTISFGQETIGERAAVGVPQLHSPHLHLILEPLYLKNYHIFVFGEPVPAHIITLCLFAFHTFHYRRESPIIYLPTVSIFLI